MSDFVNREAEEFLLGMLMVDPAIVPETVDILGTTAEVVFFTKQHQLIYDAILACYEDNDKYVDTMLVFERLETAGDANRAGGHLYLYDLQAKIVETDNFRHYAELVKKNAVRRQTASHTEQIRAAATDPGMPQEDLDETVLEHAAAIQSRRNQQSEDTSQPIEFPKDLIEGVFDEYIRAYFGCTEVSPSFLFGTLKTLIGSSLGRRVSLAGTHPLFPNFFTCIVGHTALARKSTALTCAEHIINQADQGVFILRSLSTPEGLISALTPPDGYTHGSALPTTDVEEEKAPTGIAATMGGNTSQLEAMLVESDAAVEGFRICLSIDEFSHLLKKAGKPHGDGLIQMLSTAYNFPSKLQLPTRVSPLSADHPCVTMMGATTLHWLEASLKLEDIQGGFANRITYFLGSEAEQDWLFEDQPGDPIRLARVAKVINGLRLKYPEPVQFRFTPEASVEGQKWYESHRKALVQEKSPLVIMAAARTDVHVKKTALLFSALDNPDNDCQIHKPALEKAILLSEYLQRVVAHLYSNFNFSDDKRLETKIVEVLEKRGASLTAREIKQRISWASSKAVNAALKELVTDGTVEEFPTKRTTRFAVRKNYVGEV